MLTGIIDNTYTDLYGEYDNAIQHLKAQGYQAIDFQGFINTETALWKLPEKLFLAGLKNTKEYLDEQGIVIYQAHAPWAGAHTDATADSRKERFEKMHQSLKGAQVLGTKYLVVHPILPFGNEPNQDVEEVIGINLGFIGKLADYAKYYGITICLENLPFNNYPLSKPEEIRDFVEDMNHPNLKVCLDTGHCAVFGIQPGDAVRMIGPELLKCLHVHDNDGTGDQHLPPKKGIIDWEDFRQALKDINFQGALSLECKPKDGVSEEELYHSAAWLACQEF